MSVVFERLTRRHDRTGFDCGVPVLNDYLRRRAMQDVRRMLSSCFVCVGDGRVQAFYTLSAGQLASDDIPARIAERLPRYPLPVARIGRLAVSVDCRGEGLGGACVADAAGRALRSDLRAFALLVDAKDENAEAFYRHLGFEHCGDGTEALILPLSTFPA